MRTLALARTRVTHIAILPNLSPNRRGRLGPCVPQPVRNRLYRMKCTRVEYFPSRSVIKRKAHAWGAPLYGRQVLPYRTWQRLVVHICSNTSVQCAQRCLDMQRFFGAVSPFVQQTNSWIAGETRDDQF